MGVSRGTVASCLSDARRALARGLATGCERSWPSRRWPVIDLEQIGADERDAPVAPADIGRVVTRARRVRRRRRAGVLGLALGVAVVGTAAALAVQAPAQRRPVTVTTPSPTEVPTVSAAVPTTT